MSVVHVGGSLGEQTFHLDNGRRWFPRGNLGQRVIRNLDGYRWQETDVFSSVVTQLTKVENGLRQLTWTESPSWKYLMDPNPSALLRLMEEEISPPES